jgi:hypothetical protein
MGYILSEIVNDRICLVGANLLGQSNAVIQKFGTKDILAKSSITAGMHQTTELNSVYRYGSP